MKKFISIVALATVACAVAFAQESGNRDAQGNIVRGPYQTNKFFDNTFIELQGGFNLMGANHMGMGIGAKSINPSLGLGVNIGKWFNPNFGLRLGWQGVNTYYTHPYALGESQEKNNFNYTHADFLVNISNWFSGYKPRVWDFVPYIHVGWVNTTLSVPVGQEKTLNKFGAGVGLLNKIRVHERVNLTLDLRAMAATNRIMGGHYFDYISGAYGRDNFMNKCGGVASAFVGVTYNFGKTGWERVNAQAPAKGLVIGDYIGAAKKDAKLQGLQKQADAEVAASKASWEAAKARYAKAAEYVDADGHVLPTAYNCDPELGQAYADMANYENRPDFPAMTRAEKAAWDLSHKDILPAGWKKMKDAQKLEWVDATIYAPAQVVLDEKEAAARQVADARASLKAAGQTCNDAVVLSQWFVDDAAKRIDANNNILPAAYPAVDAATAQKYADIANTEVCPDFSKMSAKETRKWIKAHKDILPKNFKKLSADQKTDWVLENIFDAAFQAKADKAAAAEELEIAKARKIAQDALIDEASKTLDKATLSDGVGYFTIGKSFFNEKQLANWKKSIKNLDKAADYTVVGYADKETGTPALNAKLRKERSEYVTKLLKENGFTGTITPAPAKATEKFVNYPIWKNRSAVIK